MPSDDDRGMHDLQPEDVLERIEVTIAVEQRMRVLAAQGWRFDEEGVP